MELSHFQRLSFLIESLTTSGKNEVDQPNLKQLKSMCKNSNECIEQAFRLLFTQLEKDHSEIRLGAVHIIDELFQRSHTFRELLLENFNDFMELTAGTNFDMPLPDPKAAAHDLMKKTVKCVHAWHQKYGPAYKKLVLGFNYLKGTKKIQMLTADEVQTQIQRNALEHRLQKRDSLRKKTLEKIATDIDATFPDIKSCVAEMEACFSLLVPKFNEVEHPISETSENENPVRESGIMSSDYVIELNLSEVVLNFIEIKKSQDNEIILENLKDREKLLKNVYLPKVKRWLAQLGANGAPSELLKQTIDLKTAVTKTLEKTRDLVVMQDGESDIPSTSGMQAAMSADPSDESSDDDFIEVIEKPKHFHADFKRFDSSLKKQNEPEKKDFSRDTNVWKPLRSDDSLEDPASYSRALSIQKKFLEVNRDKEGEPADKIATKIHPKLKKEGTILAAAPFVPFGPDLLEWDEAKKQELKETLSMGRARELDIGHRFWTGDTASKGDEVSEAALTALTSRSIAFTGEFVPVSRSCGAPLPSGKLCPRKDRFKCPFHGPIIPRDEAGVPSNPEDRRKFFNSSCEGSNQDWQDPALLRELKAITGIDLKLPEKQSKKKQAKRVKYENLTDIRDQKNTTRYRLRKKVLDPKSIKRVSETLDKLEAKRNFQKFGNNFNYALN